MKTRTIKSLSPRMLALAMSLTLFAAPALAQSGTTAVRTNMKIVYHNGPVMQGTSNIYLIWYGNWIGNTAPPILTDLVASIGSSAYFNINKDYPDANGVAPNGALIYSGAIYFDAYSHGDSLKPSDIQAIVRDWISGGYFPLDPAGIYLVLATADVTDVRPDGTFCTPSTFPHHGAFLLNGTTVKYGFVGNPDRCGPEATPQFHRPDGTRLPTPNGNFGADAMATLMAHLLDVIVTSPLGNTGTQGGWYDRYGLENAQKCQGFFGQTYQAPNGAPANVHLGTRDFLLQENWVNARKGYCALAAPQP